MKKIKQLALLLLAVTWLSGCLSDDEDLGSTDPQPENVQRQAQLGQVVAFWGQPPRDALDDPSYFVRQVQPNVFPQKLLVKKQVSLWEWQAHSDQEGNIIKRWWRLAANPDQRVEVTYTLTSKCREESPQKLSHTALNDYIYTYRAPSGCDRDRLGVSAEIKIFNDDDQLVRDIETEPTYLSLADIRTMDAISISEDLDHQKDEFGRINFLGQIGLFVQLQPSQPENVFNLTAFIGNTTGRMLDDVSLTFTDQTGYLVGGSPAQISIASSCQTGPGNDRLPNECSVTLSNEDEIPLNQIELRVEATASEPLFSRLTADCRVNETFLHEGRVYPRFSCKLLAPWDMN